MRPFSIFAALALLLSLPSQANAVLVSAPPKTQVPAFLEGGSESRIGLLCHNDPVNKSDPTGLEPIDRKYVQERLKELSRQNAEQKVRDTKLVRDAAAKATEKVTGDKKAGSNIAEHNKDHAKVVDRNKLDTSKSQESRSTHSESAHEAKIPDSSKYVLKVYDNDRGTGTNVINVTTPLGLGHVIDAIRYNLGAPVNAEYAADYLGVNR